MRTLFIVVVLLSAPWLSAAAAAQNDLGEAKAKYEEAAYEDALTTLTKASASTTADRVQLEQYRALCLIALGRISEAERAVAALVDADPTYVPPSSVASPRVLAMIAEIRRKELPGVARRVLDSGRAAYEAKDIPRAQRQFDLLLKLLDDPIMEGRPEREDLLAVARGFSTLLVAAPAPRPPAAETERPAAPPAAAAATPPAAPAVSTFVPASVIQESLPIWTPPNPAVARNEYNGAVKVRIGTDGRVKAATIDRPTHPAYDTALLNTARSWLYKPATQNGTPIESERVIAVRLRPLADQGAVR
jgi:TonB family protein